MRTKAKFAVSIAPALMLAGQLLAGGFWLQLGNPEASAEARKANAVVTIKATGCHNPENAEVTATAIGMVNGPPPVHPVEAHPAFPTRNVRARPGSGREMGKWVIETGRRGMTPKLAPTTLAIAGPEGVDRVQGQVGFAGPIQRRRMSRQCWREGRTALPMAHG